MVVLDAGEWRSDGIAVEEPRWDSTEVGLVPYFGGIVAGCVERDRSVVGLAVGRSGGTAADQDVVDIVADAFVVDIPCVVVDLPVITNILVDFMRGTDMYIISSCNYKQKKI